MPDDPTPDELAAEDEARADTQLADLLDPDEPDSSYQVDTEPVDEGEGRGDGG
jgi:hypothetical protein